MPYHGLSHGDNLRPPTPLSSFQVSITHQGYVVTVDADDTMQHYPPVKSPRQDYHAYLQRILCASQQHIILVPDEWPHTIALGGNDDAIVLPKQGLYRYC